MVEPRSQNPWIDRAATAGVLAAALVYWLWYFNRGANLLDEGSTVAQAMRILNGQLIYRDFFTVVTPASYYTVAAAFALFGAKLIVMRWLVLIVGLGITWTTLRIARQLMPLPFAAAAALLTTVWGWLLTTPNFYSLEAMLFALLALVFYLRYVAASDWRWIVAAGLATSAAVLTKQNIGVYVIIAMLLLLQRSPAALAFLIAATVPVVVVVAALIAAGAGPYLYESWIYYPLVKYPAYFALPYGQIPEPQVYVGWMRAITRLPIAVYSVIAVVLFLVKGRARESMMAVVVFGVCVLLQIWPRADFAHILYAMPPVFVLLMMLLSRLPPRRLMLGLVPALALLWVGYLRTDWEYSNYGVRLTTDRAVGTRAGGDDAQRIDLVTGYIQGHTAPGEPIFVVPWAAGFYFLADRPNPTKTDFMLFEDPEVYPCVLSRLEERQPKYVIYGYVYDVDGRRFSEYAKPIDNYIRTRYVLEDSVNGYEIWRRTGGVLPQQWPGACEPRRFRMRDLW